MAGRRNIMKTLKPKIFYGMKILFIGINPPHGSVKKGHYFSNNSYFFTLLYEAGFTDYKCIDNELKKFDIGIMNYSDYVADKPKDVPKKEWDKARKRLNRIFDKYNPQNVIFIGKTVPKLYYGTKHWKPWKYGMNTERIFTMHFPTIPIEKSEKIKVLKKIRKNLK